MVLVDFKDLDDRHDKSQTQHGEWRWDKNPRAGDGAAQNRAASRPDRLA